MTCAVSVVVPVFGEEATVEATLRSVADARADFGETTEIVAVLNRRSSAAAALATHVVAPPSNLGFAAGVAAGIERSHGEWVLLVNDDCRLDRSAITALVRAGRSGADVGSVAASVRFARAPAILNSAGIEVDALGVARERLVGAPAAAAGTVRFDVFGASGTLALYRRAMLDDAGGIDTSFFAYYEDADLAWRALMRGWRCLFEPAAIGFHDHSGSFGHHAHAKEYLVGRNRVRMLAKNATSRHLRRHAFAMLAYDAAYIAYVAARRGSLAPLRGRVQGLREWASYRQSAMWRAEIQLPPPAGLTAAHRRDRAYSTFSKHVGDPNVHPARRP